MTWLANVARSGTATAAASFSATVASAVTAGDSIIVVGFSVGTGCTVSALDIVNSSGTSKGETVTEIDHYNNGANGNDARAWIVTLANNLSTSDKLKVTVSGSNFSSITVWADSFSGATTVESGAAFTLTSSASTQQQSITSTAAGTLYGWFGFLSSSATSATVSNPFGANYAQTGAYVTTTFANSAIAAYADEPGAASGLTCKVTWNSSHTGVVLGMSVIAAAGSTSISGTATATVADTSSVSGNSTAKSGTETGTLADSSTVSPQGTVSQSFSALVLASSPVGYWRLGDAVSSTTAADSSGNSHTLTQHGTVTFAQPGLLANSSNTAAAFGSGYLSGTGSSFASTTFTVAALVDGTPQASTVAVVSNDADTAHKKWGLYVAADGTVKLVLIDSAGIYQTFTSTGTVKDSRPHLVHGAYGSGTWQIFIDGALDSSGSFSWTPYAQEGNLNIGTQRGAAGTGWVGVLDEVAYYNTVLSADTISAQWAAVSGAAAGNAETATVNTVATVAASGGVSASESATFDDTPTVIAIDDGPDATVADVAVVSGAHTATQTGTVDDSASITTGPAAAETAVFSSTSQITILGTNPSTSDLFAVVDSSAVTKTALITSVDALTLADLAYVVEAGAPHEGVAVVRIVAPAGVVTFTSELT